MFFLVSTDTFLNVFFSFYSFNIFRKLNSNLEIDLFKSTETKMFKMITYEKFRDTKDVSFFDISINKSNYRFSYS